jgi:hypothetical protein
MAGPIGFPSDAAVVVALCQAHSISYVACLLKTSLTRVRLVRDAHKTAIVMARLKGGQTLEGICFNLDLLASLDRMRDWHQNIYLKQEPDHAQD